MPEPLNLQVEHIALNVHDPIEMADWYVQHLNMRIVRQAGPPTDARFLADASGRVVLEIYNNMLAPVPDYNAMDPLMLHIAFVVEDLAGIRETLRDAGASVVEALQTTPSGDELAMLRDPWGLAVQLVKRAQPMGKN